MLELFERGASLSNRHGHYGLFMVKMYGLLSKYDGYPQTLKHFELALDQLHAEAAFRLG